MTGTPDRMRAYLRRTPRDDAIRVLAAVDRLLTRELAEELDCACRRNDDGTLDLSEIDAEMAPRIAAKGRLLKRVRAVRRVLRDV